MPVLANGRWEQFCQLVVYEGVRYQDAYAEVGYSHDPGNAHRFVTKNDKIAGRLSELREQKAKEDLEALGLTKAKVLRELMAIGFSDPRNAVRWSPNITETVVEDQDDETGLPRIVKTITINNSVQVIDSDKLTPEAAASISMISQDANGGVKIKFHNKAQALTLLGKELGLFKEPDLKDIKLSLEMMVHESLRQRAEQEMKTIEHEPAVSAEDLLEGL